MPDPTLTPAKLAAIRTMLSGHRTALETMVSMNAQASVNRTAGRILADLDGQARRYLDRIARHERSPSGGPFGTLGAFGENGCAPAIADICRQAEFHRCRGALRRAA